MLKLICGPSGFGKSAAVIEAIRADVANRTRAFLLVPEQQAYISERDLAERLPSDAGLYFEIVNFSRLADDVFREYGGVTQESVSGGIRALLMWNTLRTLSPLLCRYGGNAQGDAALTERMLSTVAELRADGIDASRLEDAAQQMPKDSPLQKKLMDLSLIDAAYHAKMEECFGDDPADKLLRLVEKLQEHPYFAGAHLYVDSFTDFTVPEYAVLFEILKQASSVTVTLCADRFTSRLPHFERALETERRLTKLAERAAVPIEKTLLQTPDPQKAPPLSALEKCLWDFSVTRAEEDWDAPDADAIRLFSASNIYEETELAALRICALVQSGMRYRDIAVVVRDTEVYRGVLDAALERYGIPYFLSERTDLSSKPVCRLILSALRAVCRNYRQNDVITLLKTGLCDVCTEDAAMFEEYCETWHINGARFTDPVWSMNPDGLTTERSARAERILQAANETRARLMTPLLSLAAALRLSRRMEDRCRALYDYLCDLSLSARLSERAAAELDRGEVRAASESIRLYRMILESLTTLCRLLPNEELSTEEFLSALTLLFSNSDLGSVPNEADCVVIGSASTLRVEHIRASLVLGLCEGEFPCAVSDDGILTEADKEALEAFDLVFDSRTSARAAQELFFVYRAMTKPSQSLSLFTVAQSTDGAARAPSPAFTRVAKLFEIVPQTPDMEEIRRSASEQSAANAVAPLSLPPIASPVSLHLSQTKIQTFVLCPYRYYVTYRLHLREQKDATPSYADDGVFLHYVFEHFLRAALTEEGQLTLPEEAEMYALADRIIDAYISEICPFSREEMDRRLLHLYARLRKLALLMLKDILAEIRTTLFRPYRFEQTVGGREDDGLPFVTLTLKNGATVLLSGKIDRVDIYRKEEKVYLRVVDYKSGKHLFSLDEVKSGMDIQLVLYLFALKAAYPDAVASGAQYLFAASENGRTEIRRSGFYLSEEEVRLAGDGEAGYMKKLIPQSAQELGELEETMRQTVCGIAERILSGEAEKTPSEEACNFCPVRANCNRAYHK